MRIFIEEDRVGEFTDPRMFLVKSVLKAALSKQAKINSTVKGQVSEEKSPFMSMGGYSEEINRRFNIQYSRMVNDIAKFLGERLK